MQLPLQNFSALVGRAAAAVQGAASALLDVSVGSTLRAILEANASIVLWLQWLIVLVLQTTRAATSTGNDLDTWVGDFGLTRLPATAATGQVQFSRFVATMAALIPVGATVRTADGTQTFSVVSDLTNPAWQQSMNGFLVAAGVGSITVPCTALTAGAAGNVQAGTISLMATAIPGLDTVSNTAPFSGGADPEPDAALRLRFQLFLQTRSRATPLAIGAAVLGTRQGLSYSIAENTAPDGSVRMGSFIVTVDDGTGAPQQSTLTAAATAIESVRPVGTTFAVQPPAVVPVSVSLSIIAGSGYDHGTLAAQVNSAITGYVDALTIGSPLNYSRLIQVAYDVSPGVVNVTGLLLAGGTADIQPGSAGVIKVSGLQVN